MYSYYNMYIPGSFLVLFAGLLSSSWAIPYLQENGYRDVLSNEPLRIEVTAPTFNIKSQVVPLAIRARFVLVLDNSSGMTQDTMDRLKTTAIRWITQLSSGIYVAIVKFGTSATLVYDWVEAVDAQGQLISAITDIIPNGGGSCMSCGLQYAGELMLDPNSPGYGGVVVAVTGSKFNDGTDVGDPSVWLVFKELEIRVLTILMGTEKDTNIHTLARETKGKVFAINYDGSDLDGIFDWASQTYIPAKVADDYEWVISDRLIPARESVLCGFRCIKFQMYLDQIYSDISVYIRIKSPGGDVSIVDFFDSVTITDLDTGNIVDGYTVFIDEAQNLVLLQHVKSGNSEVDVALKRKIDIRMIVRVTVTAHRSSPNSEPYTVECKYPDKINHEKYIISGFVKQGQSIVKGANVYAQISKSQDDDPNGLEKSCITKLWDDGQQYISDDVFPLDGIHSNVLDQRNCWSDPPSNGERMQVLCTLAPSPDTQVTSNDFFSKRNLNRFGLQSGPDSVTSNQTWSHDRDVKFVNRNTYNASIKVEDLQG